MTSSNSLSTRPCQILIRSKTALELFDVPEHPSDPISALRPPLLQGPTTFLKTSPDGAFAYVHIAGHGIVRIDLRASNNASDNGSTATDTNTAPFSISKENTPTFLSDTAAVQMMDVSPLGTFLLTWERYYADKKEPNNLKVWNAADGQLLAAFAQKTLKREGWPYVQWTHNEAYAFLHTPSEIRIYTPESLLHNRYVDNLRIPGILTLNLPRTRILSSTEAHSAPSYMFTSFCGGTKDKPARASLHEYAPGTGTGSSSAANPYPALLSKSLFQAEECVTHWNPAGDTALLTIQTSVDASGQSYYGSSQLFLLAKHLPTVQAVPLPQEGPVHDVAWMPSLDINKPSSFLVIAGRMPSLASMHQGADGKATFLFGSAHRNVIDWAPHGRFVLLGGFGNLSGSMSLWDRNKLKLIPSSSAQNSNVNGTLRADAVVGHGWAPNSRVFAVSTCSPRMNVDNGVRIFRYNGDELLNVPWKNEQYRPNQLLEAAFVPAKPLVYPDRPQTPIKEGRANDTTDSTSITSDTIKSATAKPAGSGGRYVPPSMRGRASAGGGTGSSLAERMRREKEGNLQKAGKVEDDSKKPKASTVTSALTGRSIPGLVIQSKTKSKSALKKEKTKLKQAQQDEVNRKVEAQKALLMQGEPIAPVDMTKTPEAVEPSVDPEKRARKLKKMLKQIEELKQKAMDTLNDDQQAKISSEPELLAELASLKL